MGPETVRIRDEELEEEPCLLRVSDSILSKWAMMRDEWNRKLEAVPCSAGHVSQITYLGCSSFQICLAIEKNLTNSKI
jgi:hypothetical protein